MLASGNICPASGQNFCYVADRMKIHYSNYSKYKRWHHEQ